MKRTYRNTLKTRSAVRQVRRWRVEPIGKILADLTRGRQREDQE